MKKLKYKLIIAGSVLVVGGIVACNKSFLDKSPLGTLNQSILATPEGVQGLLIGAYSLVDGEGSGVDGIGSGASNWTFGGIASDDAYKGSDPSDGGADWLPVSTWVATSTNPTCGQKWGVCFAGAQRCNDVIRTMAISTGLSAAQQKVIMGEAVFLRAFFHFEAKRVFNNIPYIDEKVIPGSTADITNSKDAWPMIEKDFQTAIADLPATQPQVGRVNVWAAKAYLARVYMYEHKYALAKTLLDDVITNGTTSDGQKYGLIDNYFSNFNPAQKNSKESVFAAQTSVNDNSSTAWGGSPNGNFGDILNFPYNGGPGGCCGFYNPSQDLANAYKVDGTGLPLLDTWFSAGTTVNSTSLYAGPLDPRIDLTAGRPGVPYLDWGKHPGDAWIRNPGADGHLSPKKNVYALAQKGTYSDVSSYWAPTELTANNVNLLRFSDVLLLAAEAEVEIGSLTTALNYVNMVRTRAANPAGWVYLNSDFDPATFKYKTQTTPAGNYQIGLYTVAQFASQTFARKAVQFERRLELAMEGQRFFDLVRWDNGTGTMTTILNAYAKRDAGVVPYMSTMNFVKGKSEYFPIPQSQIDQENSDGVIRLKQNPGY